MDGDQWGSSESEGLSTVHFRRPKLFEPPEIEVSVFSLISFLRRSLATFWTFSRSAFCLECISRRFCEP
jgi:hypothetical protein